MDESFGIIYSATGKKYVSEAQVSANSCKSVMPGIQIHIWTDVDLSGHDHPFDRVNKLDDVKNHFIDKIGPLYKTPFSKTLFVDTDTYFLKPVYDLIPLLDRFDLAYCHAPWRVCPGENNVLENVPRGFPEPNTGVIAFRSTQKVLDALKKWEVQFAEELKKE